MPSKSRSDIGPTEEDDSKELVAASSSEASSRRPSRLEDIPPPPDIVTSGQQQVGLEEPFIQYQATVVDLEHVDTSPRVSRKPLFGGIVAGGEDHGRNAEANPISSILPSENTIRGLLVSSQKASWLGEWLKAHFNVFDPYVSTKGKTLAVITLLNFLMTSIYFIFVISVMYTAEVPESISEPRCGPFTYTSHSNTFNFIAWEILICSLFATWYMLRGIKTEKPAMLIMYCVVSTVQIVLLLYFSLSSVTGEERHAHLRRSARVICPMSAVLSFIGMVSSYFIYATFGWRLFAKGVTHAETVRAFKLYRFLDAALKTDMFICVWILVPAVFLAGTPAYIVLAIVFTTLSVSVNAYMPRGLKRRGKGILIPWYLVCLILPVFYVQLLVYWGLPFECPHHLDVCLSDGGLNITDPYATYAGSTVTNTTPSHLQTTNTTTLPSRLFSTVGMAAKPGVTPIPTGTNATVVAIVQHCCETFGRCDHRKRAQDTSQGILFTYFALGILIRLGTVAIVTWQVLAINLLESFDGDGKPRTEVVRPEDRT